MKTSVDGQNHLVWLTTGNANGQSGSLHTHSAAQTDGSLQWASFICKPNYLINLDLILHFLYVILELRNSFLVFL